MILYVLNENFLKINVLKRWEYYQYNDCFRDIGTFEILIEECEENIYLLDKTKRYYILFDSDIIGYVQRASVSADSDYQNTISISGSLLGYILNKRIINGTQTYSGNTAEVITDVLYNNMIKRSEGMGAYLRYINFNLKIDEKVSTEKLEKVQFQKTGGTVWECIQDIFAVDSLGYDIRPNLSEETNSQYGGMTNIYDFDFIVLSGRDLTFGNKEGNIPVMFSHSIGNMDRSSYEYDKEEYSNVCYIAGEGEGSARVWYKFKNSGEDAKDTEEDFEYDSGWGREETFVDARDLQKVTEEKTYTDAEYKELLKRRALENFEEHVIFESYDSTIIQQNKKYKYGVDFYKGDYVTIRDNRLGIELSAQITQVTKTVEGAREILDITFGYQQMSIQKRLKQKGVI